MHVSKIIIQEEHKMKKLIALLLTLAFILSLSCAALAENKLEKILSIGRNHLRHLSRLCSQRIHQSQRYGRRSVRRRGR